AMADDRDATTSEEDDFTEEALVEAIRANVRCFRNEGVAFDPFIIKPAPPPPKGTGNPQNMFPTDMWAIYWYPARGGGNFCPIGDVVWKRTEPSPRGTFLLAPLPGKESALAHPTAFQNLANGHADEGKVAYWAMLPPTDYRALGICVTDHWSNQPDPENY